MKKVFLSAFAMSLVLFSGNSLPGTDFEQEDFLGLESQVLPALVGSQQFSPQNLHEKSDWTVSEKQVQIDREPFRGQGHSLIPWDSIDANEWLSFEKWQVERNLKDQVPDWKFLLRQDRQSEHMGKVLQCRGKCEIYRGSRKAFVGHLSRIDEGDEFKTLEDSVAWIYLMDGTLVRVGPSTSLSFLEVNWSKSEVFQLIRLHQGHVFWHPRESKEYQADIAPETDSFSLPLLVREANQANFERTLFQSQIDSGRREEIVKLEETAATSQIKYLNELRIKNNSFAIPQSRVMLVAPNASIVAQQSSFDFLFYPGGKSYFKKRTQNQGEEFSLHLRGYLATESQPLSEQAWYEVGANGRNFSKVDQITGNLEITELITRRIKTFELAREVWIEKYTLPVIKFLGSAEQLAFHHGYYLWGNNLSRRFEFLVEFMRRMETTNLNSIDNLLKKLESNGESNIVELDDRHYRSALNYYLMDIKNRYAASRTQVREMSDLQYYIWILRNGKRKN
jgi:hypothetical protein